jgi:glycosyltransferase involved in cell wall biosynthesis
MAMILMAAYTNYRRDPRVKREAEALVDEGHHVVFLARRQPGEPQKEVIAGVEVIKTVGLPGKCTSFWEYILDYGIFFVLISAHMTAHPLRYKLIHINNMPDFLVFATWFPRMFGCPVIHDVHDLMPELYSEKFASQGKSWVIRALEVQERWAGKFASAVLTVEERLKDILSHRGIPREKIHVLMNLPDERIFSNRKAVAPKPEDAPFVMVYHGTLARRLGLDIAIEAVARVRTIIPRIELRIVGAGEERGRLIELRDELRLQEMVTFSDGFVPVEHIPAMIDDADVGLVPLRVSSGTDIMLPTKLLEYVSIGIPCIVPKTGTICRYFDEQMVEFFEAENVDSLAKAMIRLYRNPQKRVQLSQEATERFASKYKWSVQKRAYTKLVANLLDA